MNEAMEIYADLGSVFPKTGSILDLKPVDFGKGNERLSEQIDAIVYGV